MMFFQVFVFALALTLFLYKHLTLLKSDPKHGPLNTVQMLQKNEFLSETFNSAITISEVHDNQKQYFEIHREYHAACTCVKKGMLFY